MITINELSDGWYKVTLWAARDGAYFIATERETDDPETTAEAMRRIEDYWYD